MGLTTSEEQVAIAENQGTELLAKAGIAVGGSEPYDLQVNDDRFWARVLKDRELGLGRGY